MYLFTVEYTEAKTPLGGGGGLETQGYYYSRWNQTMIVGMDGSLLITEEQTFRLDPGSYGFAYRNLNWKYFHDVNSWSIESGPGTPYITYHKMTKEADQIEFYWEFVREYYSSQVDLTFILTYNVSSAMDLRGARDRVYWNVIGDEFEVPIHDISTRVIFPKQYDLAEVRSTTYYIGKNPGDDTGTASNVNGKTQIDFYQSSVSEYQSYTIDADTPPAGIRGH